MVNIDIVWAWHGITEYSLIFVVIQHFATFLSPFLEVRMFLNGLLGKEFAKFWVSCGGMFSGWC